MAGDGDTPVVSLGAATIRETRLDGALFDLITELSPDTDLGQWEQAGLTWAVTDFGLQPTEAGSGP